MKTKKKKKKEPTLAREKDDQVALRVLDYDQTESFRIRIRELEQENRLLQMKQEGESTRKSQSERQIFDYFKKEREQNREYISVLMDRIERTEKLLSRQQEENTKLRRELSAVQKSNSLLESLRAQDIEKLQKAEDVLVKYSALERDNLLMEGDLSATKDLLAHTRSKLQIVLKSHDESDDRNPPGFTPVVLEAMRLFPREGLMHQEAVFILMHLADQRDICLQIVELGGLERVLLACTRFKTDPNLLAYASRFFFRCAGYSVDMCDRLRRIGTHSFLLEILSIYQFSKAQKLFYNAGKALRVLVAHQRVGQGNAQNATNADIRSSVEVADIILNALDRLAAEADGSMLGLFGSRGDTDSNRQEKRFSGPDELQTSSPSVNPSGEKIEKGNICRVVKPGSTIFNALVEVVDAQWNGMVKVNAAWRHPSSASAGDILIKSYHSSHLQLVATRSTDGDQAQARDGIEEFVEEMGSIHISVVVGRACAALVQCLKADPHEDCKRLLSEDVVVIFKVMQQFRIAVDVLVPCCLLVRHALSTQPRLFVRDQTSLTNLVNLLEEISQWAADHPRLEKEVALLLEALPAPEDAAGKRAK